MKLLLNILIGVIMLLGATAGKSADIKLTPENVVVLRGEVNHKSVSNASHAILTHPQDELYLFIDSPGGSVFAGLQLANILEHTNKDVTCIANIAASMAFYILQHCETRLVMKHSILMQHVASYYLGGNAPNNYSFARFIKSVGEEMEEKQAKRIGMSTEEFKKKVRDDWWLYGVNAYLSGAADGTTSVECSNELSSQLEEKELTFLFWKIRVTYNKCPLISGPVRVGKQRIGIGNSIDAAQELEEIMRSLDARRGLEQLYSKKAHPSKNR